MITELTKSIIEEVETIKQNNPKIDPMIFEGILEDCHAILELESK